MEAKKGRRGTGRTNRKTSRGVCGSVHHNDGSQDSSSLKALTRVYDTSHTELSYNLTCGTGARGGVQGFQWFFASSRAVSIASNTVYSKPVLGGVPWGS